MSSRRTSETYEIGSKSEATKVADAGLGRLGLELAVDGRHQTDVNQRKVVDADTELELAHGLDEGSRLDVSNGSTELRRSGRSTVSLKFGKLS